MVAVLLLISACGTEEPVAGTERISDITTSNGPTTTNQSPRDQLTCELVSAISVTPEPNGEGFDTPEQAVESYADWVTDLPQGTWEQFQDEAWILINQEGHTVGRANVGVISENAVTTFDQDRYWSGDIEYCP